MLTSLVLATSNFCKPFAIKIDASFVGIGAVLLQDERPLAYISKVLSPQKQGMPTYEKKICVLDYTIYKWQTYLNGVHFIIQTD